VIFPRDVFKATSKRHLSSLLCPTHADYSMALKRGWFATGAEALADFAGLAFGVPDDVAEETPITRAELEAEARRLGVKLDSRNSNERLAERILEAHAASEGKG
jgi:hypothetical protein